MKVVTNYKLTEEGTRIRRRELDTLTAEETRRQRKGRDDGRREVLMLKGLVDGRRGALTVEGAL